MTFSFGALPCPRHTDDLTCVNAAVLEILEEEVGDDRAARATAGAKNEESQRTRN
jgi:hypothetical protein